MRTALIMAAGFTATYYLGWLPPSFVVPALFALGFMARAPHSSRDPRRGGNVKPPASSTTRAEVIPKPWETDRTGSSSSSSAPGLVSEAWETPRRLRDPSRLTGRGWSTVGMEALGASGVPLTFAASVDGLYTDAA